MIPKEVWIVVPFSRPQFTQNVVENFLRQKYKNKNIIIVENGDAIGKFQSFEPNVILTSKAHPGAAKNAGIHWLKDKFGSAFWTTFDDDDYYGPNYLNELVLNSNKAEVIGKSNSFVKTTEGKLRYFDYYAEDCFADSLFGYSISAWTDNTIDFPEHDDFRCGEDNNWLQKMKKNGAEFWATSRYNSLIIRRRNNNHTWSINDQEMVNVCFGSVIEYDEFDLDFINKIKKLPKGKEVKKTLGQYRKEFHGTFFKKSNFFDFAEEQVKKLGDLL